MHLPDLAKIYKEAGLQAYKESIISFVDSLDKNVKEELWEYGRKWYSADFRIPKAYDEHRKEANLLYSDLFHVHNLNMPYFSPFDRKWIQDLRNIAVVSIFSYPEYGDEAILPREKKEILKIFSSWDLIKNIPKLTQKYWYEKPLTDLEILIDEDLSKWLKSILYTFNYNRVSEGVGLVKVKYECLPLCLKEMFEKYDISKSLKMGGIIVG